MKILSVKNSMIAMIILVVLVVCQHISHLLELDHSMFLFVVNCFVMIFAALYFIQLNFTLQRYYSIQTIKVYSYILSGIYVLQYLCTLNLQALGVGTEKQEGNRFLFGAIIAVIMLFVSIAMIVFYALLGGKLYKEKLYPDIRKLGFALMILVPTFILLMIILLAVPILKPYSNILIIIELSPYWFTYKIYRDILRRPVESTLSV